MLSVKKLILLELTNTAPSADQTFRTALNAQTDKHALTVTMDLIWSKVNANQMVEMEETAATAQPF